MTNAAGQSASAASTATITAAKPVANAGGPYSGVAGTSVTFSAAASTDPGGLTLTYAWTFGDGGTGTGVSPTHVYAAAGTYNVGLTVTNSSSQSASGPVHVVVFSDFACPYSARLYFTLRDFTKRNPGQLLVTYKQSPLTEVHTGGFHGAQGGAGDRPARQVRRDG